MKQSVQTGPNRTAPPGQTRQIGARSYGRRECRWVVMEEHAKGVNVMQATTITLVQAALRWSGRGKRRAVHWY